MSDMRSCKKCGRYPEDATWWDKIPDEDKALAIFAMCGFGLIAFIVFLAAL